MGGMRMIGMLVIFVGVLITLYARLGEAAGGEL